MIVEAGMSEICEAMLEVEDSGKIQVNAAEICKAGQQAGNSGRVSVLQS